LKTRSAVDIEKPSENCTKHTKMSTTILY